MAIPATQQETMSRIKVHIDSKLALALVFFVSAAFGFVMIDTSVNNWPANQVLAADAQAAAADATNSATLTWTAPGDDGNSGQATRYDIRYLTQSITGANWGTATVVPNPPTPKSAGQAESFLVTGLQPDTTYYFALKTYDEAGNASPLSNIAVKKTSIAQPPACTENWQCSDWSVCTNGNRARTCSDLSACGTASSKPAESEMCQTAPTCLENWQCSDWSSCSNGTQTRTCTDANSCGQTANKPSLNFDCTSGHAPAADTIGPNTQITSGPGTTLTTNRTYVAWTGVDDQTATGNLEYSYRLDARPWSAWSNNTSVTLRSINDGRHALAVRSRDSAGNVDVSPAQLIFNVRVSHYIVAAVNAGGGPLVRILGTDGKVQRQFFAYEKNFRGGVNVAVGDLGGDGIDEIVAAPGPGRAPQIRIYRRDGSLVSGFYPYAATFRGGVSVAVGDVNGDGLDEIITAPQSAGGPQVRVFGLSRGRWVPFSTDLFVFDKRWRGGLNVAACDFNGNGADEVVTAPISNAGPQVKFYGLSGRTLRAVYPSVTAFDSRFRGGVNLGCGDLNNDGRDELITAVRSASSPAVKLYGLTASNKISLMRPGFFAFNTQFHGGASVSAVDINADGSAEVIAGIFSNGQSLIRIFDVSGRRIFRAFYAFPNSVKSGISVGVGE